MHDKKILIVHHGALGDFIAAFPALHLLLRQHTSIDAVCQNKLGKLAGYLGLIGHHIALESAMAGSLFSETVHPRLRRIIPSYHAIILFSFSEKLEDTVRSLNPHKVYRIDPRPEPDQKIHVSAHLLSGLMSAGFFPNARDPDHSLFLSLARDRRNPAYDASHIFLHPGSGSPRKNWPLKNFFQLAGMLGKKGQQTTFLCGPAEQKMIPDIAKSGHALYTGDDLVDFAMLLEQAGGCIGNDSGIGHLSAYLGVPTVAVFGPTDPDQWRPIGTAVSVVQADTGFSPGFGTDPNRSPSSNGLNDISPSRVLEAFFDLTGTLSVPRQENGVRG